MSFENLLKDAYTIERFSQLSIVIGTDGNDYFCSKAHTSAGTNKPITGANFALYWTPTGGVGVGSVWVTGIPYALSYDVYGMPVKAWADYGLVNQPCRLASSRGREIKIGAEVVIADYVLFIGNVDITEQDRIVIAGITYEILLVQTYADSTTTHHKQCWLRVVR